MLRILINNWWLFISRALLAFIFAGYLWFIRGGHFPPMIQAFVNASSVILFAVLAFGAGIITLGTMLKSSNRGHHPGLLLWDGIASCTAGIVVWLVPSLVLDYLIEIIASWAIFVGLCEVLLARDIRRHVREEWLLATAGVGSICFGILLLQGWIIREELLIDALWWYALFSAVVMAGIGYRLWMAHSRVRI